MVTNDESLYPPRCCSSTFVVDAVASVLGASLLAAFNKKAREFSAPDRVYCHVKTCSEFLGPVTNAPTASTCPTCISRTCTRCKSAAHGPFTSCDAQQDEEVLALGEREGWKRSPACNALIELAYGCYHMTCRCRKQFCYVCRETWKNCTCPQWEKNRLIAAAQDRVRRQEPPPAPAGSRAVAIPVPVPFERVLREAERLRDNHEYRHPSWRYRAGGGHCESCYHFLAQFLFVRHATLCQSDIRLRVVRAAKDARCWPACGVGETGCDAAVVANPRDCRFLNVCTSVYQYKQNAEKRDAPFICTYAIGSRS
jgi:hypothetical protein